MFKNFRDKIALSGITVLMIGIALLIFTFISAYGFLTQALSIITSEDLAQTFGQALAPLITTCIHLMYLGVMGWLGSLITIRGVTIIAHTPQMPQPAVPAQAHVPPQSNVQNVAQNQQKPALEKEKVKPKKPQEEQKEEPKKSEPEFIVIPPEPITQQQPTQQQAQLNNQQKNNQPQSQSSSS